MSHLYDVMYEFNFSLPPDYALVIRALGSLEGTAKALDPDFKVIESAYPFVIGRLLEDPSPDMRKILRQLLICDDGSIRWNRLERLVRRSLIISVLLAVSFCLVERILQYILHKNI
jgi:aarF domain-containing kinase